MTMASKVEPGSFEPDQHFYPRVLNAQLHPLIKYFLNLGNERIAERYCHLHPEVLPSAVSEALAQVPRHFRWGGADLFHVATPRGQRRIVVIETNSSPSGNKSMPLADEAQEAAGYQRLLERAFVPALKRRQAKSKVQGGLAVLTDKNPMECGAYAATLADLTGEPVWLAPCHHDDPDPSVRVVDQVVQVRGDDGEWHPIRAAMRYVTQRPWTRLPLVCKTMLFNPVLTCVAGGRNKLLAAKAYDVHNAKLRPTGLAIRTPETIWDVGKREVPLWVQRMGGMAVVKNPYANAGQGVWTITSEAELEEFLAADQRYDQFIVQSLVGNAEWSSESLDGKLYHVGTVPDKKRHIYVADLRLMVAASPEGFFPVAIYARRARKPLARKLQGDVPSWDMLGTNLSLKNADGSWSSDSGRLLLMDERDFNRLGLGLDDLIEGYLQTILSVTAIDQMASSLLTKKGTFRRRFFGDLNPDPTLVEEIRA